MAAGPATLLPMNNDRDRVISISLSEAEWQAFTAKQPQPVSWLRDRILGELRDGRVDAPDGAAQRPPISNIV